MALICPVGHPPGTGTSFCRLCGRDYVEAPDAFEAQAPVAPAPAPAPEPVLAAGAPVAAAPVSAAPPFVPGMVPPGPSGQAPAPQPEPQPEPLLAEVVPMPPVAQPLHALPGAPVPDLHVVPPVPMEAVGSHAAPGLQVQLPLVAVPAQGDSPVAEDVPAPVVEHVEPPLVEPAPSPVKAAVDRTVLLAAAGAGFVGGALASLAMTSLLG